MERQIFINEMQARFNLRKPRSEKPTNLYLVCRINNKQVKLSTGVKIYPDHWNEKRQEAYISVRLSEIDNINKYEGALKGVNSVLIPVTQMRDNFTFSLTKLEEYKQELQEYQDKYNLIELLKKYSSPTKGGIQTIFMQLYMDKTLSLANQLLGMLFNGDIELLPYIINENEFRIPTRSNITNLVTDDVSNCSTSEKSMIAMILSFALAFHGSQTYNIVRLDEVDGGLDQANRAIFPLILDSIIQMLQIEQCFIISHSSESDMSDVDVISLTPVSNETIKGNVIFQL